MQPDEPLRILQLTNRLPWPLNDGGNIATWNVGARMVRQGHDVTLLSLNPLKHRIDPKEVQGYSDVYAFNIDTTFRTLPALLALNSHIPYNIRRFLSPAFADLLRQILTEKPFDIVQVEGSYLAIYSQVIREFSKAKLIMRSHNIEHRIWERVAQRELNGIKKWYLHKLSGQIRDFEKRTLKNFDGIIPITAVDEQWYLRSGFKGKLQTIPAGTDVAETFPDPKNWKPNACCFLGSLEWTPNVEGVDWFLEKVWPNVVKEVPTAEFHLAGKNPPPKYRQIQKKGVYFHGEVPDAAEFLRPFGILVVPLLSGSGMRLKVVEAIGSGKVVVTTSVGVEGIEGKAGTHFSVSDSYRGMADEIIRFMKNRQMAEKFALAGWEHAARHYSWDMLTRKFPEFYRKLL